MNIIHKLGWFNPRISFTLSSSLVCRNPYPYYKKLRRHAPVHYFKEDEYWAVSRYRDVIEVLKNPAIFSSVEVGSFEETLAGSDPPQHTKMRKALSRSLSPQRFDSLEKSIRQITNGLIDAVVAKGHLEVVSDLAMPLPYTIMSELLGIDPEPIDMYKRWTAATVSPGEVALDAKEKARIDHSFEEFRSFFEVHVERCLEMPGNSILHELLSGKNAGEGITTAQAVDIGMLLLVAGNETTTNLIANSVLSLHPQTMRVVWDNPQMIPAFIEEVLCYEPPVQFLFRQTGREVEIDGVGIPAGARVLALLASANRDEQQFPDPDSFSVTRNPTKHLSFGFGSHFCLGAHLARMEARILLETMVERFREIKAIRPLEEVEMLDTLQLRRPKRLELVFESRS